MMLTVRDLGVQRGRTAVIEGLDLDVAEGEVVAILGPNGAGKSTLLSALGGLLPATGTITAEGRIATVLQHAGFAKRSVRRNVDLAQAWWGVPRGRRRARSLAALEALGAGHLARRPADALSGGEARRVHLARGVAVQPDVLLLDEPFAGLDPASHAALVEETASALRTAARATVVVLHDRADAWALADRIVVMMAGRIVADGTPEALLAEPPSLEVARFLGYDGVLAVPGGTLLTRAAQVRIDPEGDLSGEVTRRIRREDGALLDLALSNGRVRCLHHGVPPEVGAQVRVSLDHTVSFPTALPPEGAEA
ncbi:ABC transporter ATP-binding protein [Nocardioides sp.]|uniref:ABC transporter ATP-binding protein n=1 Tax=Nocardioides sp. TaxID=35761 RepID=UPI0026179027|nr:ABC transporter ATP-binding protein [Nocardioides sp.]